MTTVLRLEPVFAKLPSDFDGMRAEAHAERYRLLEPIRFFARGRLDEARETPTVCRRHAEWVLRTSRAVLIPQTQGAPGVAAAFRAGAALTHRDKYLDLDNASR